MSAPLDHLRRCCLTTGDPGQWTAGVDDSADTHMIRTMHSIRDRLSYQMPVADLIWALKASVNIDSRTTLGGDIQRCLLSNAAHRLEALALHIDPVPWAGFWRRAGDAWAIIRRRGVCIIVCDREQS